jgi:carbamoyl-phosphate synthase small subunit
MKAALVLENGMVFQGHAFGSARSVAGEVVFSTGMVGYPEALTDPSYYGQLLTFTYPLIGNYGVPKETLRGVERKQWESSKIQAFACIISHLSETPSHWNADLSLDAWLKKENIPGIFGIDTRALTKVLRENGSMLAKLIINDRDIDFFDPNASVLIEKVCVDHPVEYGEGDRTVLLIDFGSKNSIIDSLLRRNFKVVQVPYHYDYSNIAHDGVVLSSGPGDPAQYTFMLKKIRELIHSKKPLLGICLGHQLLALAAGAETYKMRYGHRSQNQPVVDHLSRRCYITTQNHGFAVNIKSIPDGWISWFENLNDGSNEGLWHKNLPVLSSQFHPEASPGPVDTAFIFDEFKRYF